MAQRESLAPPRVQERKLTSRELHINPCTEPCHFWPEGLVRPRCECRNVFLMALCRGEEKNTYRNQKDILFILRETNRNNKEAKRTRRWDGRRHCSGTYILLATLKVFLVECLCCTQTILPLPIMLCSPADNSRTNSFSQHTNPDTSCILLLLISTTFWESISPLHQQ